MVCETCSTALSAVQLILMVAGAAVVLLLMLMLVLNRREVMQWWIGKIEWIQERWFK